MGGLLPVRMPQQMVFLGRNAVEITVVSGSQIL
jgi:hypothetical protein